MYQNKPTYLLPESSVQLYKSECEQGDMVLASLVLSELSQPESLEALRRGPEKAPHIHSALLSLLIRDESRFSNLERERKRAEKTDIQHFFFTVLTADTLSLRLQKHVLAAYPKFTSLHRQDKRITSAAQSPLEDGFQFPRVKHGNRRRHVTVMKTAVFVASRDRGSGKWSLKHTGKFVPVLETEKPSMEQLKSSQPGQPVTEAKMVASASTKISSAALSAPDGTMSTSQPATVGDQSWSRIQSQYPGKGELPPVVDESEEKNSNSRPKKDMVSNFCLG